jgi:protoheme IX farnesyltransferase
MSREQRLDGAAVTAPERLRRGQLADYLELTKPRVTTLVLLTTLVGFYLGSRAGVDLALLLHTLVGTALAAAGASALNQYIEREEDSRMRRTRGRPLPSGRMETSYALLFGCLLSAAGIAHLALAVNRVAAGLVAVTVLSYVFAYTPLKKKTTFCTLIGALPGALPPLIGWAAADGSITAGGVILFAILFVWQMPHALAIACLYRDDYEAGGFVMLPVRARSSGLTGRLIVAHALVLVPLSLLPTLWGFAGTVYFAGALVLGLALVALSVPMAVEASARSARRLLLATVGYLPILLALMALDHRAP